MSQVAAGKVVSIQYVLKGSDGKLLDKSEEGAPMLYLHGHGNIVPGLEKELEGKAVGDAVKTIVRPEDGYGKKSTKEPQQVPRTAFPPDAQIVPGMQFLTEQRGRTVPIWVVRSDAKTVWIDTDHPLAGKKLHFDVVVVAIRDASAEELEHGHPHGPDGHGHHH